MRESDEEAGLLGRIAVRFGFITMEQLAEATRERGRGGKKLGAIMLEKGMLDELQLGKVLAMQKRQRETSHRRQAATQTARPRIPTPIDWAFDPRHEAPPDSEADGSEDVEPHAAPRRGRRTDDVMRARLSADAPTQPQPTQPQPTQPQPTPPQPTPQPAGPPVVSKTTPSLFNAAGARAQAAPARRERPAVAAAPPAPRAQRPAFARPPAAVDKARDESAVEFELDVDDPPSAAPSRDVPPIRDGLRAREPRTARGVGPTPAMAPPASLQGAASLQGPISVQGAASLQGPISVQGPISAPGPPSSYAVLESPTEPSPASEMADAPALARGDSPCVEPLPWDPPPPVRGVEFLHKILGYAVTANASDVHVHAGTVAKMRQFGRLVPITESPCSATATHNALTAILTPYQRRRMEADGEIDFAYAVAGIGRFRANIYRQQHGTNGVFHVIPAAPPTLATLELPEDLAKLTNYTQGLILLTGPAGCGKTSTMAALADIINEERADHILTIEDPIEYVYASKRCVVNQRQVGRHTESFASGLRGALREDPDIICIGELRDLETISLALSAAETGHLVLATLHTGSAIGTINRVVSAYPPAQQPQVRAMMSESLRAVTSQRLLPTADGNDVVPALEVLFVTRPVAALIRDNRTFQIPSIMQTGRAQGMKLMDDSLRDLLAARRISKEVALANCEDRRKLEGV